MGNEEQRDKNKNIRQLFAFFLYKNYSMIQRINLQAHQTLLKKGIQYFSSDRYPEALQMFTNSLQSNPISYSSYINLSVLYRQLHQYHLSQQMLDLAIKIKPYTSQAYYNRCLTMMKMEKWDEALIDINCALSCEYLIAFKRSDEVEMLLKAVEHSYNNLEAIGILKWIEREEYERNKQIYQQNLKKGYRINNKEKHYNILELDDFRLLSKISNPIEPTLKDKLCLFLKFSYPHSNPSESNKQNCSNALREKKVYEIKKIRESPLILKTLPSETNCKPLTQRDHWMRSKSPTHSNYGESQCEYRFKKPHVRCLKCNSGKENEIPPQRKGLKIEVTTVEIFRSKIQKVKPYMVIDGGERRESYVDYNGGHFPKWNDPFWFQSDEKNSAKNFKLEIWHKENGRKDKLIGQSLLEAKGGRKKCQFYHGGKTVAYAFIQISKS